jgi:hypothetical protein
MQSQDIGDHTKEVYARYGLAMYCAQVLEHGLANALMIVELVPTRRHLVETREQWTQEADAFEARAFKSTMGRLLKRLRDVTVVPPDLDALLDEALESRNWLAHDFFRERALEFMTYPGREQMIHEVDDCRARLEIADQRLADVIQPLRERAGITEEVLEQARQKLFSTRPHQG